MTGASELASRRLDGLDDVMAVHRFLADLYASTGTGRAWEVRRWEGQFWHDDPEALSARLSAPIDDIRIWESGAAIVGVAHPEGSGDVHLESHPGQLRLDAEMLAWAERHLGREEIDGSRTLLTFSLSDDRDRIDLLDRRGYRREPWHVVQRWCSLETAPKEPDVATGYTLRSLRPGNVEDAGGTVDLINAAFGHSFGPEALLNFERSPSYRADLQIIAVDRDGAVAAHAGVTLDERNDLAIVEPVCTHPDHRRRGLAQACMAEGLRRARELGAVRATVGTGHDNPSNVVYQRLGFDLVEIVQAWKRTWPPDEPAGGRAR